jgi:hypothetical protein
MCFTHLGVAVDVSGLSLRLCEDSGFVRFRTLSGSGQLLKSTAGLIGTTKLL